MAHPIIEEFCRVFSLDRLQNTSFRRMQRVLQHEVQPMLDERERLIEENAALREEITQLRKATEKRGPGRPRKVEEEIAQ